MTNQLSIGYSPCPNDTFIFYALIHGYIDTGCLSFAPPVLEDVETLNVWVLKGKLDVTKLSFHALGRVLDEYAMLNSGAALGRGCGPLLVSASGYERGDIEAWKIAIPGRYTTAALLMKLFSPRSINLVVMRFDKIMEAVASGQVDGGVIIHESRFTYQKFGLACVQDLGSWWEETTGLPIPLGCIGARKALGQNNIRKIEDAIRSSIKWALANPQGCRDYIMSHAQELTEDVITSHIKLYVNDFSLDISEEGKEAVRELLNRGRAAGIFSGNNTEALNSV